MEYVPGGSAAAGDGRHYNLAGIAHFPATGASAFAVDLLVGGSGRPWRFYFEFIVACRRVFRWCFRCAATTLMDYLVPSATGDPAGDTGDQFACDWWRQAVIFSDVCPAAMGVDGGRSGRCC